MKSKYVGIEEAMAVPDVPWTDSWHPIHHRNVITAVESQLERLGIGVVDRIYTMTGTDGTELFARYNLDTDHADDRLARMLAIGFRNSMAKKFALGFVAGETVTVCSNMQFRGRFVEFHRHTSGLTLDTLDSFVAGGIEQTVAEAKEIGAWFARLGTIPLVGVELKAAIYEILYRGIVPPSKFNELVGAYNTEIQVNRYPEFKAVAHLHGAVTRVLRGSGVHQIMDRTQRLNNWIETSYPDPQLVAA